MSIKTIFKSAVLVMALMCLTFVTASAQTRATKTVTKTVTWGMDGGKSGTTIKQDEYTLYTTAGGSLHWDCAQPNVNYILISYDPEHNVKGRTRLRGNLLQYGGTATFSDIEGKVTKVEMSNFSLGYGVGVEMYVGKDRTNTSTLLHLDGTTDNYYPLTNDRGLHSVTFVGGVDVDKNNPLKIIFYSPQPSQDAAPEFSFTEGSIAITYEVEEEVTGDPGHTFSFTANSNILTATCNQTNSNHVCELVEHKATLTLTINDAAYGTTRYATLNTQEFVNATGITNITTTFSYENKSTHEIRTTGVYEEGEYTVTATVTINGTDYILTKDFSVVDNRIKHSITNNSEAISVYPGTAFEGDMITIWVQNSAIVLKTLNVTGETVNFSLNNGIGYDESNNVYHFAMPDEDVTISATFEAPITINCKNGGSVSATVGENTNATRAQSDETVTLSATPDEGYTVTKVHVYNGNKTYNVIDNGDGTFSFTMPASAVTVEVEFSKTIGALTISYFGDRTTATIDGSSNYSLSIADDIDVDEVTYTRSFVNDGGAYTIMLPFGFNASSVKGTFHTLGDITPVTETVWKAEPSSAITEIEANTPYIFFPSEDFNEMTFENVTLKTTTSEPLTNVCGNTNWKLHGVYVTKTWNDNNLNEYGFAAAAKGEIAAGEFVHFVTGASLKPTRCYLEYSKDGFSKSTPVLPERIIVVFPDETASIVEPGDPDDNGEITTPTAEITPNSGIKVWSADGSVIIEAQPDMDYTIVDLSGRTLKNGVTHSTRETVTLSRRAAGIVIVKIGNQTFKISY